MRKPILIRGARQLLTLRGGVGPRRGIQLDQLGLVADGSVLIVNGRVREAGSTRRIENLAIARKALEISAQGRVVMPGFVDACIHLEAAGTGPQAFSTARRTLRLSLLHGATSWGIPAEERLEPKLARVLKKLDPSNETLVPFTGSGVKVLQPLIESVDPRPLIQAGEALAIATGYRARVQPSCSLAMAIATAADHGFSIAEAVTACTINGAHALGIGARAGSLETGKQADILILETSDYRDLAYARGLNLVHSVMKHGEMIAEGAD